MRSVSGFKVFISAALLLLSCSKVEWATDYKILRHEINIKLDPESDQLLAMDKITILPGESRASIPLFLNRALKIDSITCEKGLCKSAVRKSYFPPKTQAKSVQVEFKKSQFIRLMPSKTQMLDTLRIAVFYHGSLTEIARIGIDSVSGKKTALLSPEKNWYPASHHNFFRFRLATKTPMGYEAISQGKLIAREPVEMDQQLTLWKCEKPTPSITLQLGPYDFTPLEYKNIHIFTYLYPAHSVHAKRLLERASRYYDLYVGLIGDYPYSKLAITENPFAKTISAPSLLSIDSTKISHLILYEKNLGELLCENWWGNGVFCHPDSSDWTAGLRAYYANHLYHEFGNDEKARDYRLEMNRLYSEKIDSTNDFMLAEVRDTSKIPLDVWSGKSMLFFHQIRRGKGSEQFKNALRQFFSKTCYRYATWYDLKETLEAYYKNDLTHFFNQWLHLKGAPQFYIKNATSQADHNRYVIETTLKCKISGANSSEPPFPCKVNLPLVLETNAGVLRKEIVVDSSTEFVRIVTKKRPLRLQIDPDHEVFRRLFPEEQYWHLSQVLDDTNKIFVLPGTAHASFVREYRKKATEFAAPGENPEIMFDRELDDQTLQNHSLVLFGSIRENFLMQRFCEFVPPDIQIEYDCTVYQGKKYWKPGSAIALAMPHPLNPEKQILFFWGNTDEAIRTSAVDLRDYGNYGFILYHEGEKKSWCQWALNQSPTIFDFKKR
ncbi:hypothetical protein JXJ21_06580 [candidate division KSB1 bacterium]|nr:hypothetical protein [candidate division KSB1 bacterium]